MIKRLIVTFLLLSNLNHAIAMESDLNILNETGYAPLYQVIIEDGKNNQLIQIENSLKSGAKVDLPDEYRRTALHEAAYIELPEKINNYTKIIKALWIQAQINPPKIMQSKLLWRLH